VAPHYDPKAVKFVKTYSVDHARLAIAENNGFANQLGFGFVERVQY
jgi:hypothetical protein